MRIGAHAAVVAAFLVCAIGLAHCSDPADPVSSCVTLKTDCMPLHDPPTFATIYSQLFQPNCATGMGTCHTPDAAKKGLYFQDPAQAYQLLLGMTDGRARVLPSNPGCSILAQRLESNDPAFRMPPGSGLTDAQLCDVVKWLAAGAPNN